MTLACVEHVNVTVENPDQLAELLCELFDWKVRWSGPSKDNGYTVHVGSEQRYLALYRPPNLTPQGSDHQTSNHLNQGALNHIGLVVKDGDAMEQKILAKGIQTQSHNDYGVCKSFYFMAEDNLEIEIASYRI